MPERKYMKENTSINYKGYEVYLNRYGEHCVSKVGEDSMVHPHAGFDTLEDAKRCIDILKA